MRLFALQPTVTCALVAALLAACGGNDTASDDVSADDTTEVQDDTASQAATPSPASAPTTTASSSAPISVDDIDRWQRGMQAELAAVQEAGVKLKGAKTGEDSATAVFAAQEMSTRDAGARAAGLDPERYQFVRTTLSSAVAQLSPIEMEIKVKEVPAAVVEQMKQGRETALARMSTQVPAPVVDALRPRAGELRKQEMALVGERLKAAGMGR